MSEFDLIIGHNKVKRTIMNVCDQLKDTEKYKRIGIELPRGIMLYGEPGIGKTLMANCLIKESGVSSFVCRRAGGNDQFEQHLNLTFERAKSEAKKNGVAIVLLDDMDKYSNTDVRYPDAEEYVAVQSCIDNCADSNVLVIATVNDIEKLPKSLLREGRFDIKLHMHSPSYNDTVQIIKKYLKGKNVDADIELDVLADIFHSQSGAFVESLINSAAREALYFGKKKISMKDIVIKYINNSTEIEIDDEPILFDNVYTEDIRKRVAYHEAGHILVGELMNEGSVSIAAIHNCDYHGITKFGFTPHEAQQNNKTNLVRGLGGKAAEELKFGGYDGGAEKDLEAINVLAKNIIERQGAYDVSDIISSGYMGASESMEFKSEMNRSLLISNTYKVAVMLVANNMIFLDNLARELMDKKYITRKDIAKIKEKSMVNTDCLDFVS